MAAGVTVLDKDPNIFAVLDQLRMRLGSEAFVLADHWESDNFAVGIASPRDSAVLVYISTYQESMGRFSYELELPPLLGDDALYRVVGCGNGVSFEELAAVVDNHLRCAELLDAKYSDPSA